jgi:hypothetical protein
MPAPSRSSRMTLWSSVWVGDDGRRLGSWRRKALPMTAFFVTHSWRPISLAQTPSFHNAMSAAARSGVHSCVIDPDFLPTLTKRPLRSFALTEDNEDNMLCYFPHIVHEEGTFCPRLLEVSAQCETNATPWSSRGRRSANFHHMPWTIGGDSAFPAPPYGRGVRATAPSRRSEKSGPDGR